MPHRPVSYTKELPSSSTWIAKEWYNK
ncbi:cytosolic protein, partial [Geobacillus zalihae]